MDGIASQITSLTIVYSIVYSHADQRKHQSSASLAFVRGLHRDFTGELSSQMASYAENVSIWCRHRASLWNFSGYQFLPYDINEYGRGFLSVYRCISGLVDLSMHVRVSLMLSWFHNFTDLVTERYNLNCVTLTPIEICLMKTVPDNDVSMGIVRSISHVCALISFITQKHFPHYWDFGLGGFPTQRASNAERWWCHCC